MPEHQPARPPDGQDYLDALLSRPPAPAALADETYLKIWEIEQNSTNTRWTVLTFFLSVSFAIFGFSFQAQLGPPLATIARLSAVVIYWFAYMLFARFNAYTRLLRTYLRELEQARRTALDIQTRADQLLRGAGRHQRSATRLLLYFGLFYTAGGTLLWLLGL